MLSKISGGCFYRAVHSLTTSNPKNFSQKNFPKNYSQVYSTKNPSSIYYLKDFPNLYIKQNKRTNFTLKPPKKKEAKKKTLYLAYFSEYLRYRLSFLSKSENFLWQSYRFFLTLWLVLYSYFLTLNIY